MNTNNIKILLVVVLYNQKLQNTITYSSLLVNIGEGVLVYDNSPTPQHVATEAIMSGWKYVSDTTNGGISKAYNLAGKYALENGYNWMLFLDQDTIFSKNILDEYKDIISRYEEIKLIAAPMKIGEKRYLSPVRVRFHMARPAHSVPEGKVSLDKYSPINSGLAVNVAAFHEVGGYNENVRLDFSDYEFIRRFKKNYSYFYVLKSVCFQSFSNIVESNEQKLRRFDLFCDSLKNCEKNGWLDNVGFFSVVVKRMLALMWQTRSLKPVISVIINYF